MSIQLETITRDPDRSFSMMFNPRLSDLYFWHVHPEYELVYIEAERSCRHVGDHSGYAYGADLVLIGANIPHLNFDYGIKGDYRKVVVHLKQAFIEAAIQQTPELSAIKQLLALSAQGAAFTSQQKTAIGEQLFELQPLSPFEQFLGLLSVLQKLATMTGIETLHPTPYNVDHRDKEQNRIQALYGFVDNNYQRKITLKEVAELCHMSPQGFCRYFKKTTRQTFVEFLNGYRVSQAKRLLIDGNSISEACYQSGFDSLSYFNRVFKQVSRENPSQFCERHRKTIYTP